MLIVLTLCFLPDGFYLCRLCQNVHENTKRTKIQWLNERDGERGVFDVEWVDFIDDYSCFICYVRMTKVDQIPSCNVLGKRGLLNGSTLQGGSGAFALPETQRQKIEKFLSQQLNREKGVEVESSSDEEDVEEEEGEKGDEMEEEEEQKEGEEEEADEEEEVPKKKKKASPKKSPSPKKSSPKKSPSPSQYYMHM